MTRVGGISGGVTLGARTRAAATGGGFTVTGGEEAEGARQVQDALPVGLAGMLALQEAETEGSKNRNGRRHGLAVLDALRDLQQSLLGGQAEAEEQGAALARLAETTPSVMDSKLAQLLSAIRLRAKIELHRLETAQR